VEPIGLALSQMPLSIISILFFVSMAILVFVVARRSSDEEEEE
jgi:hypothetical protein